MSHAARRIDGDPNAVVRQVWQVVFRRAALREDASTIIVPSVASSLATIACSNATLRRHRQKITARYPTAASPNSQEPRMASLIGQVLKRARKRNAQSEGETVKSSYGFGTAARRLLLVVMS